MIKKEFCTVPKSGTYISWDKFFKAQNFKDWNTKIDTPYVVTSAESLGRIDDTRDCWIAFSSKYYNLAPLHSKKIEIVYKNNCYNFLIESKDHQLVKRPIFLFGELGNYDDDKKIHYLRDTTICQFWRKLLDELEIKPDYKEEYGERIENIRKFLHEKENSYFYINDPLNKTVLIMN